MQEASFKSSEPSLFHKYKYTLTVLSGGGSSISARSYNSQITLAFQKYPEPTLNSLAIAWQKGF